MKSILFIIVVLCSLAIYSIALPGATAQCLSENDDLSRVGSTDLSAILDFNLRLFQDLVPKDVKRNFIFSPYSIWNALVLAYYGSAGQTEAQFRRVLGLGDKVSTLHKWRALEYLYKMRPETTVNNTFILANRAYFDKSIRLRTCMQDILHNEMETLDFRQPEEAAYAINGFVSNTTRGTIEKLVSAEDLIRANLVLVNAAFFKGTWEEIFDKRDTRKATFTGFDNTNYLVDMMVHPTGKYNWAMNEELQTEILELPYVGKKISLLIFLPYKNTISNFNNVVQGLSMRKFERAISELSPREMSVNIPKFKLETYCGDELLMALVKMGLTDAFNPTRANFGAFTVDKQQMSMEKSIHKAFIDVNEEGTTASAATAFIGTKMGGYASFICNRPFIFAIRDSETKNLLFMGVFKSSEQTSTGAPSPGVGTDLDIEQNRNNINPIDWHYETPGKIVPPIDRNKEYTPTRETNIIPEQNYTQFGINKVSPPIRGSNSPPERSQPPVDSNNQYTPIRGLNSPPEPNQRPVDRNNEYTPNRGTNSPPERNQPPVDGNNEYTPIRGLNSPPERSQPPINGNREYSPTRETNIIPERNVPLFGTNNENPPISGTNLSSEPNLRPVNRYHNRTTFTSIRNVIIANRRQTVPRLDSNNESTPFNRKTITIPEGVLTTSGRRRPQAGEGSQHPEHSVPSPNSNVDYNPIRETFQRPAGGTNMSPEQDNAFNLLYGIKPSN